VVDLSKELLCGYGVVHIVGCVSVVVSATSGVGEDSTSH